MTSDFWRYQDLTLGAVPNNGEYTALFDMYRIAAIKHTWRPRFDSVEASSASTSPMAYAHVLIDPESTLIPSGVYGAATLNTFLENGNVRTFALNREFSIYYKPKVLMQASGGSTAGVVRKSPWIRTSDTAVAHRGHHVYVQQNNFSASATANIILDHFVTVYLMLKNTR